MNILLGQTYEINNLITREGKFSEKKFHDAIMETKNEIMKYEANNIETVITTTRAVEFIDNEQILDVEILLPVGCFVPCNDPFVFKDKIKLINALHVREYNIENLNNTMNQINQYILDNMLQPITSAYLIQKKQEDKVITDIYISINPNII